MSNTSRKLSSDEVSALMAGLQSGDINTNSGINTDIEVTDFTFGSDNLELLGDYYALRLINERFARLVRSIFLPMIRIQPKINPFPPEVKTYDEYSAGLNSFMSLTTSRIDELRGSMLLVLEPSFISVLTNCYYGGKLANFPSVKAEFTATEERIIEIVSDGICQCLQNAWKDLMPITIKHQAREVNPQFATLVESSDSVIICSFVVQLPNIDSASFDVIYPLQTLKPIASLLRSRVQSDVIDDDVSWRERMEKSVLNVPLPVSAILSEPSLSLSKLVRLKKGDIVNLPPIDGVDFFVDDKLLFKAEIGETNGQVAVSLKNRL
ncbi:flagellar motor switch protein FliM [Alphaproteobacteria bacterium]|jgi:flagellar motor switch protein FliM|nr:flagellar motor switch protein FliM [Alphaproteobacteria bacterium]MDB9872288.1 flagellar motor switch protein FliM [Alphaproteobacteria bacterium]|tara:strand:+ start:164 stop:1132 length:969 start_codon:yes stop_codon:yes gene_type:complete